MTVIFLPWGLKTISVVVLSLMGAKSGRRSNITNHPLSKFNPDKYLSNCINPHPRAISSPQDHQIHNLEVSQIPDFWTYMI